MKTSISLRAAASRNNRMVDAGRGLTISAIYTPVGPHPEERPSGRVSKDEWHDRGLLVRDARRRAPHHEELLACRTRLRLQIGAAVVARHPRQEIIDFRLGGCRDSRTWLALGAGGDDAALL